MDQRVIVTKEMAKILDSFSNFKKDKTTYLGTMTTFLNEITFKMEGLDYFAFLKEQKINLYTLENIYRYGYVQEYAFKKGDVVINDYGSIFPIKDETNASSFTHCRLVCKAENREDKNHASV